MKQQFEIPVGAQHISLLEPLHFKLTTENETIVDADANLYYVHRGIENACTTKFKYRQVPLVVGRVCGLCSVSHGTAAAQVIEKLTKVEIPLRAKYLRMLVIELDRIHSHLLCLAHVAENSGFEALFMQTMRDREYSMELLESVCGNRVQYDYAIVGGVNRDLRPDVAADIKTKLALLKPRVEALHEVFETNWTLSLKNKGIGTISKEMAMKLNAVGPLARAAGVPIDVRNETEDLLPWKELGFEMILDTTGDVYARNMVRIKELYVAFRIIDNILNGLPEGDIVNISKALPEGEALVRVEAPRGELMHYARGNKSNVLERLKIKAPTFSNVGAMVEIFKGNQYASAAAIIASYDPCLSCTAR